MNKNIYALVILALFSLAIAGCSTDSTSAGNSQAQVTNPPPQVRVESMPSPTATQVLPAQAAEAPTMEPTATAEVSTWSPPSEDEIINRIEVEIDSINQQLNNQKFIFNP